MRFTVQGLGSWVLELGVGGFSRTLSNIACLQGFTSFYVYKGTHTESYRVVTIRAP